MRTFAFSPAFSSLQWWHKHFCRCVVGWWGNDLLEKASFVGLDFIWNYSTTWLTKQLYKWLCHCKGGKGWRTDVWWGRGCCFSHQRWIMLAYCVYCSVPSQIPQMSTDLILQKNLTPSSKKSTLIQDFGYSKFCHCIVTVQTLFYAECNLYLKPKQIIKRKKRTKKKKEQTLPF